MSLLSWRNGSAQNLYLFWGEVVGPAGIPTILQKGGSGQTALFVGEPQFSKEVPDQVLSGGERGIRTLDTGFPVYSLSRRAPSTYSAISPFFFPLRRSGILLLPRDRKLIKPKVGFNRLWNSCGTISQSAASDPASYFYEEHFRILPR